MSEAGNVDSAPSISTFSAHRVRDVSRIYHAIGTTILFVLSTVEMYIGAWLIHAHQFETLAKSAFFLLVYTVFVSVWTMSCAIIFITVPLGRPKQIAGGIKSISAHFCFLALLWVLWLASASGISGARKSTNCGTCWLSVLLFHTRVDVLNSIRFRAFHALAWVNFAWTSVLLVAIFIFGVARLREERVFSPLSSPPSGPTLGPRADLREAASEYTSHAGPSGIIGPVPGPSRIPVPGPASQPPPRKLKKRTSSMVALLPSMQSAYYDTSEGEGSDSEENLEPSAA